VIQVRRALLSAYHKEGLDNLADALVKIDAEILSTGGTYRWLKEREIPVVSLEEWADLPSLFGGRVKTLHPKVHGGILFRRDDAQDEEDRRTLGIEPIDLVAVNLYPFAETIRKDPAAREAAIEMIDVGGPTMLRAAAKNHRSVAVICDPDDYGRVADALRAGDGRLDTDLLRGLAAKAFRTTGLYDAEIASYLAAGEGDHLPELFARAEPKLMALRYGENPSQRGAYYGPATGFPGGLAKLQGKEISFNNLQDLEVAVSLVRDLGEEPAAVVIKHATPCGAAVGDSLHEAYKRALAGDSMSAFGGIVALNGTVDRGVAEELVKTFLEVVAAPAFDEEARSILRKKKNLRLLEGPDVLSSEEPTGFGAAWYRNHGNGILLQDPLPDHLGEDQWRTVTKRAPSENEKEDLLFCWRVVRSVRSNAIALARGRQAIGIGGGQTSRIDALWISIHKAKREGHDLAGSVMASDAFFPFPDCVEEASKVGVTAIIQPGGSKRDNESIEAADRLGIAMVVNDARCFRHG